MDATKDSIQIVIENHEIRLIGILTFNTSAYALELVQKYLKSLGQEHKNQIVLNLSEITRSDSSGLALLTGIIREAKKNNIVLKIINLPDKLFNLAKLSGLDAILLSL